MTTELPSGDQFGQDDALRAYSAPHLIRLDTRETAIGTGGGTDGVLFS